MHIFSNFPDLSNWFDTAERFYTRPEHIHISCLHICLIYFKPSEAPCLWLQINLCDSYGKLLKRISWLMTIRNSDGRVLLKFWSMEPSPLNVTHFNVVQSAAARLRYVSRDKNSVSCCSSIICFESSAQRLKEVSNYSDPIGDCNRTVYLIQCSKFEIDCV